MSRHIWEDNTYKCSAAAEMGDRARAKWAEKWGGGFCAPSVG